MGETAKVLPAWKPYRPSNGTEGQMFIEAWCANCARDARFKDGEGKGCSILGRTLLFDLSDPLYPVEWIRAANDDEWPGTARCTAFRPLSSLSEPAIKAWETRRRIRNESFTGDLFDKP